MTERLLHIEASAAPTLPARVTGLLVQRQIPLNSLHAERQSDGCWRVQITISIADNAALERIVKWLNRLVDVTRVVVLGPLDDVATVPPVGVPESRCSAV